VSRPLLRVPLCLGVAVLFILATAATAYASASGVVISEFRFRGPAGGNDEFVELMNTASVDRDISNWRLEGCAAASGAPSLRVTVPAGTVLKPGQHYLFTNSGSFGYSGSVPGDRTYGTGLSDTGGARIVTGGLTYVDGVGSLDGAVDQCREGTGLFLPDFPNADYSFERKDGGRQDTDDNVADFVGPKAGNPENFRGPRTPVVVPIHQIQGSGSESPLAGDTVLIEGVVTGWDDEIGMSQTSGFTFPEDAGIFVQEEAGQTDASPATSEGIFVGFVRNRSAYPLGTVVRVQGVVNEKFGLTMLSESFGMEPTALGNAPVPAPVEVDEAAAESQAIAADGTKPYYESLENMRVHLDMSVANAGGTNKFGELFLTPGPELGRVFRTDPAPGLLGTDEDAGAGDPSNPLVETHSTTEVNADLFDRVENVVGPLGFSFSHYKVMVQPGLMPTVVKGPIAYPYDLATAGEYQMRVVSFNVLNFFPAGAENDHAVVTQAQYEEKRNRIADAINRILKRPDVVALQEVVEESSLQDLAARLGGYSAYLVPGNDSRGIDVAYLVKDSVAASNLRQLGKAQTTTQRDCADGTISGTPLLFDRPPLALDIEAAAASFTIFVNHFASKSHPDSCRAEQAAFVRDRVAEVEAAGREAIVLGDLNSFEDEVALSTLEDGTTTLTNLWSQAPAENRYSFAFQGKLQTLDHVLVTDGLDPRVEGFLYAHFNNDYYERDDAADGHKVSDHDPPVVTISTSACPGGDDRTTVFVGPIDTGVSNYDSGDGCSVNDLIVEDAEYRNQGAWVSHVAEITNDLVAAGVLRGDEKGRIESAAARWQNR
jgi:predicted extracellular nuclease